MNGSIGPIYFLCISFSVAATRGGVGLETLTKEQYGKMLPSKVLIVQGRKMTKLDIDRESSQRRAQVLQQFEKGDISSAAAIAIEHQRGLKANRIAFAAQDSQSKTPFERTPAIDPSRVEAIRIEAAQLSRRAEHASRQELEDIEKRAGELLNELQHRQ